MKFVCDSCNTKYSIADERVHGRVLKIRCKTCDHVITVREEMKPPEPAPAATSLADSLGRNLGEGGEEHTMVSSMPPPATAEQADEWYVSFDGDQEGPLTLARALDRVRLERPRGKDAHAWRPGFFVWLSVDEIPEFAPALERVRKATPPPPLPKPSRPMATVKSPSGAQPVVRSGTGPQPVVRSGTGPQPVVRSGTGPQPVQKSPSLVKPEPLTAGPEPLPPIDSKPMALPPPPEALNDAPLNLPLPAIPPLPMGDSIPSGPMSMQLTKPEPRLTRRALEEADKEAKPAPLLPPLREPGAPEVSAFAAALAAVKGEALKPLDTGPVPLPPPPGSEADLAISEPSGLMSISHLAGPSMGRSSEKAAIDTFGGVAVTPPGSNGASSAAPVVVVAGPVQSAAAWVKYSVAALLILVVGLIGTVVYLVTQRPVPTKPPAVATTGGKPVEDKPIQLVDPGQPTSIGPPSAPVDPKKPAPAQPKHPTTPKVVTGPKLSNEQKNLAALYGDSPDKGSPKETNVVDRGEHAKGGGQVSESSIMAVVTQNRRALNLCYDRVLKHDSSLKRARLVTHVKVGLSGSVVSVTVPDPEYASSEIGLCLTQTIKHWHFPAADAEYETQFPIILQAE